MKKTIRSILSVTLVLLMLFSICSLAACKEPTPTDVLWEEATYTKDTTLGSGSKSITVQVTAGDKSITFTLKTDKETLEDVMKESSLVEGDEGQYGLYIKKVNGILADYDVDASYWGINADGEPIATGASGVIVQEGVVYEFIRKQ